jgi:ubiquinone/menaquinone biosynthesis C-methylase UbiE
MPPVRSFLEIKIGYDEIFSKTRVSEEEWYYDVIARICSGRTLDVACGHSGGILSRVRDAVGTDISTVALRHCVAQGWIVVNGVAEFLPFRPEAFDSVTCLGSLEHFRDPRRAVSEIGRVLKVKGTVIMTVMAAAPWYLLPLQKVWSRRTVQPLERALPRSDISKLLGLAGLEVRFFGEYKRRDYREFGKSKKWFKPFGVVLALMSALFPRYMSHPDHYFFIAGKTTWP